MVPPHRDPRLRRPGRRADRPAEPRVLPPVPPDHAAREPVGPEPAGGGDPGLEPRVPRGADPAASDGAGALRRRRGAPLHTPAVGLPLLLLLQRRVLGEPLPAPGGRLPVPRRAGALGGRLDLRAPLRGHASARSRPRARAGTPLPRPRPLRRPQRAAGRSLDRPRRARALSLLRVPRDPVRRPVARVQGDAGGGLVAGGIQPEARRASRASHALAREPAAPGSSPWCTT